MTEVVVVILPNNYHLLFYYNMIQYLILDDIFTTFDGLDFLSVPIIFTILSKLCMDNPLKQTHMIYFWKLHQFR
nr:hypothetical protein CJLB15_00069 [Campylobacter phage CJLB-15]